MADNTIGTIILPVLDTELAKCLMPYGVVVIYEVGDTVRYEIKGV